MLDAWRDYLRDADHARHLAEFRRLAKDKDSALRELGYAVLLALAGNSKTRGKPEPRPSEGRSGLEVPRQAASLLRAIGPTDAMAYAFQVRNRLEDEEPRGERGGALAAGAARPRPRGR